MSFMWVFAVALHITSSLSSECSLRSFTQYYSREVDFPAVVRQGASGMMPGAPQEQALTLRLLVTEGDDTELAWIVECTIGGVPGYP
jgi:hypothetical protein